MVEKKSAQSAPTGVGDRTQDLLHARWEVAAACHSACCYNSGFPCLDIRGRLFNCVVFGDLSSAVDSLSCNFKYSAG